LPGVIPIAALVSPFERRRTSLPLFIYFAFSKQ
jgi:hypothetical protein